MNETTKMIVVLTLLSVISGGLLGALNHHFKDRIENQVMTFVKGPAIRSIMAGSENDALNTRFKMKVGNTEKTFFVGVYHHKPCVVAFEVEGNGFADKLGLMVSFDVGKNKLHAIDVTTLMDTPGLGMRAKTDPKFAAQFRGLPLTSKIKVTTDGGVINALSGATITSRGVCAAATHAVQIYEKLKPRIIKKMNAVVH